MRTAVRRLLGPRAAPEPAPAPAAPAPPPADDRPPHREALVKLLARGEPLDRAIVTQVRALVGAKEHDTAVAIAESLCAQPHTEELGRLAAGIAAARRGYRALAWSDLHALPRTIWAVHAPAEYVRSGLTVAPDEALREIRALVAEDPPEVRAKSWHELLVAVWGRGESQLARAIFTIFERHADHDDLPWRSAALHRDWMRPWVAANPDSPTAPQPGRRTFAVMDYGHPSATKASANIGDHVQTIAALGHLVRHRNVRLDGSAELVGLLDRLGERTRPERRREDVTADIHVITAHRDASIYEPLPEDTWILCFGWFMHSLFRMRHGFPLHRNLRPIFVSFHCNKRELLTPDAIAYLKHYGPVGCRDWTTVDLLLSIGVPAFFSGCLTTTIDTVFPDLDAKPPAGAPVAYVDVPAEDSGVEYKHSSDAVRKRSFVPNVAAALELLERYRGEHSRVVTSRLHCYLPVRSLAVDVDFRPKNRSDVRFDGLIDISDAEFDAIRDGIDDKLERVFGAILGGAEEDDVYALWREITRDDVAAAERRHRREHTPTPVDLPAAPASPTHHGPPAATDAVDVAIVVGKGGALGASALIASLLEHASRPLHLWVLARRGAERIEQRLAERFPELTLTWVPVRGLGPRIRLLLPDLVPVERVVLLPLPSVATADVAELAGLDLGDQALAAPLRPGVSDASGFGVIHAAALRLENRNRAASELRRSAHARHAFDFDAFGADVLVLDLERLRREGFVADALALMEEFGLDDVEALHYLFGPRHAIVPERWAYVPTRAPHSGAGLIHWADAVKPWQQPLTPYREEWRRHASAFAPD